MKSKKTTSIKIQTDALLQKGIGFFIKFGRDHYGELVANLTKTSIPKDLQVMLNLKNMLFWKTENKLESKKNFHKKIKKYYFELADNYIPAYLINEIVNKITDSQFQTYSRFWNQYPKSRKRYSKLKIEDLEHPNTYYEITDFLKQKEPINYTKFSKIFLKMNDEEFRKYEISKYQYETK